MGLVVSAFTDEFGAYLLENVLIAPRTTTNVDRTESFGADVSVPAYIERGPRMIRDASRRLVLADALVIIDIDPIVEPTARLTMPDGRKPLILHVARYGQLIPHQEISI
jgi:hypothetical protein